jgi:hypothetical protein
VNYKKIYLILTIFLYYINLLLIIGYTNLLSAFSCFHEAEIDIFIMNLLYIGLRLNSLK